MGVPEEIPNIEQFPLSPPMAAAAPNNKGIEGNPFSEELPKHSLTPVRKGAVEFWHQGEEALPNKPAMPPKRVNHARRADQLGLLLAVIALVVLVVTGLALSLTSKKYAFKGHETQPDLPKVDFYHGNNAFSKKVQEEKDAKAGLHQDEVGLVQGANEDLEISLKDQMESMNAKLETMRSQKLLEEPPIAPRNKGRTPDPVIGVRPTDLKNFNAPLEFNGMLPKLLQQGQ